MNGARTAGLKGLEHGIREGGIADLVIVDGNPLDNFKVMYGTGVPMYTDDGRVEHKGGVVWTLKNGIVFDAKALLREVAEYVKEEKSKNE